MVVSASHPAMGTHIYQTNAIATSMCHPEPEKFLAGDALLLAVIAHTPQPCGVCMITARSKVRNIANTLASRKIPPERGF